MITVAILINGQPITARSAVRKRTGEDGVHTYRLDDGSVIQHRYDDGAILLAIEMLKTIKLERDEP